MATMIVETIKQAIEHSGKTRAEIGRETGVDVAVLWKLVHGGTASVQTLDTLCGYFGLELRPKRRKGKSRGNDR
ncbi:MAG: helix-turn-helix transcriptional regulator [Planctomycetes bacterium]|jgi:transcriptional regulator with XRE-family HTH domain|nr:helix-turn-helix transcriptional regulator [Planctomycetota bacterium]